MTLGVLEPVPRADRFLHDTRAVDSFPRNIPGASTVATADHLELVSLGRSNLPHRGGPRRSVVSSQGVPRPQLSSDIIRRAMTSLFIDILPHLRDQSPRGEPTFAVRSFALETSVDPTAVFSPSSPYDSRGDSSRKSDCHPLNYPDLSASHGIIVCPKDGASSPVPLVESRG